MKLVRYGRLGAEKPGVIGADGKLRALASVIDDITPEVLAPASLKRLKKLDVARLPAVGGHPRLGCPLAGIGKMVCIGLNYTDHAAEVGLALPKEPTLFIKANSAICGPDDPTVRPRDGVKLDYEVELAAVIGRDARYVDEADALDHVAGYAIVNDVSERAFQMERGGTTTKGKSADTFGPVGPWLVTADEVGDPQALAVWTDVNGERRQDGNTANMVFNVRQLVAYVSRFMALEAGDLISTGTPAGVGHGSKPPRYLKPGDVVEMGITGLGVQRHTVVDWTPREPTLAASEAAYEALRCSAGPVTSRRRSGIAAFDVRLVSARAGDGDRCGSRTLHFRTCSTTSHRGTATATRIPITECRVIGAPSCPSGRLPLGRSDRPRP